MKRAECDRCKTLADADPAYGTPPKHWVHVRYNPTGYTPEKDFCSIECAVDWLADQVPPKVNASDLSSTVDDVQSETNTL